MTRGSNDRATSGEPRATESPSRYDFLKYTGAAGLAIAASDLVAEFVAQSPKGNPLTSTFKELADVALGEAKRAGCTYADIRFTRSVSSGVNADGSNDRSGGGDAGGFGGFGGGRGGTAVAAEDAAAEAAAAAPRASASA